MEEVVRTAEQVTAETGGSGGKTERTESGRTELQDSRMVQMAIRRGWLKGQRWPTDATPQDIEAVRGQRDLTIRERAALAVMRDLSGSDARIRQIAVKSVIAMEAQNQEDEKPGGRGGVNVDVNVVAGVQLYLPDNGRSASNRVVDSKCDTLPGNSDVPAIDHSAE